MERTGRFIVFEGGEASGKSTQAGRLANSIGALLTREPGGTPLGEVIRPLVLDHLAGELDARTELLLMVASRAEHVASVVQPTLASGRHVVCDRFSGSTVAYQGYGRGLPLEDVLVACDLATNGVDPDLNVLLDVDVDARRARRPEAVSDRIESEGLDFHRRVRAGFLALAASDPAHWAVLDGNAPIEHVERGVAEVLAERFGVDWVGAAR